MYISMTVLSTNSQPATIFQHILIYSVSAFLFLVAPLTATSQNLNYLQKIPKGMLKKLQQKQPVDVIIQINPDIGLPTTMKENLSQRKARYSRIKQRLISTAGISLGTNIQDYPHLPMIKIRITNSAHLIKLAQASETNAIFKNRLYGADTSESLPLIGTQKAYSMGINGTNTTAVVIDTGVDYTYPVFGPCTSPGVPVECKVIVSSDLATNDGALDDLGHGTSVSSIVSLVSPGSKLVVFDVFTGGTADLASILTAFDWSIQNQATYNIVALNMSLSDSQEYLTPCSNPATNPFVFPVRDVRSLGISVIASSGNNGFSNGISSPSCTPGIISVGATYDANVGGLNWGTCTDLTTSIDQVVCFSNSVNYLDILAPGALITTARVNAGGGTSYSAPFVTGTITLLHSAYPGASSDIIDGMVVNSRTTILDPRNSVTTPRLDILTAIGAINDAFSAAISIGQNSGHISGTNINASKEVLEPNHAGEAGGASIWWKYTATEGGKLTINTNGSDFDTVLAAYTGSSLGSLSPIVADNNSGPNGSSLVTFLVNTGETIWIAVDGVAGATGEISLSWQLIPASTPTAESIPTLPWVFLLALAGFLFYTQTKILSRK